MRLLKLPLPQYQVVSFNLKNKHLRNGNLRKALAAATDRQQIINEAFYGNALMPTSPLVFASEGNAAGQAGGTDIKQAEKFLELADYNVNYESGFRTKDGIILELTITTNDFPANIKSAEILAAQWRKLAIKVNLQILPGKQLSEEAIKNRNFDVLLFPQKYGADPDPFFFWHSSQTSYPGLNLTGFENETADRLITEGRTTTNLETRKQKYAEFEALINRETPVIFLNQAVLLYAIDNKIKNIGLGTLYDPSSRMLDFPNWYIMEKRVLK